MLGRQPCADRLAELAIAAPATKPRVVALTGACGAGKTSVLNLASAIIDAHDELEIVSVDAALHSSTQALVTALSSELDALFSRLGVEEARDRVRNTLASYGGVVSGLIRLAGVKVDIASALTRSPASMRADIANDLEKAGKRVVIAKRAINALAAGLPLLPPDANVYLEALEIVLRVLVPEIDGARLAARRRVASAEREALVAELTAALADHPRAAAGRAALRALIIGD